MKKWLLCGGQCAGGHINFQCTLPWVNLLRLVAGTIAAGEWEVRAFLHRMGLCIFKGGRLQWCQVFVHQNTRARGTLQFEVEEVLTVHCQDRTPFAWLILLIISFGMCTCKCWHGTKGARPWTQTCIFIASQIIEIDSRRRHFTARSRGWPGRAHIWDECMWLSVGGQVVQSAHVKICVL